MHKFQHQLHSDHHHMQQLLNCLSQEIDCFNFDSERSADMNIILSALAYMSEYPDKWNHPTEDIVFHRLLKKYIKKSESELIQQLEKEHKEIILETDKIKELFKVPANDCIVSTDKIISSMRHYIFQQNAHIEKENEFIYPLTDKFFTTKEWNAIENEIKIRSDPLFGKPSRKEFETLFQYVMNSEDWE